MSRTVTLQDIRIMKFEDLYDRRCKGLLTQEEGAEILGVSVRTFRRYEGRYEEEGLEGLYDRRLGKAAGNRVPSDEVSTLLERYDTDYWDYSTKHFYEKLVAHHDFKRSYNWVRLTLQSHGRIQAVSRRGSPRRKRERRPMIGMMLHQDGSSHEWVSGQWWDLIVTMDDANNEIYSAFFVEEEGSLSSFQGLIDVIEQHGLFCSLYTDRGSHYWHTPEAGGKVDKSNPTQVGRGLSQLGIEMIPAYSPQARGRSERMFGTLQNRLPQELRSQGITTMEAANRFLKETFINQHNAQFVKAPENESSAFVPFIGEVRDILCLQEERIVNNDNTVRYKNLSLQIPADQYRHHFVKTKVKVHQYPDQTLALFHGPRCIGRYGSDGSHLNKPKQEEDRQSQKQVA